MSEAAIVAAIRRELRGRGAWEIKTHGAGAGRRGIPDIIACHKGAFLAIECKAPGRLGTLTALQEYELDRIRAAGGLAILATNVETVHAALDGIERRARIVHIAACPEHGLHGQRSECFVCGGEVEQVPMVPAGKEEAA